MPEKVSSAAYWSGEMTRLLSEALKAHRQRVKELNRLAAGEASQTPEQRETLIRNEQQNSRMLGELSDGVSQRARVVTTDEMTASRERLPPVIRDAYELLFIKAYGSDPSVSLGDPVMKLGIGKTPTRTSGGQAEGVGGAASAPSKRVGASTRNVIRDRRAYELKIKIDRRLRKISKEILEFLAGAQTVKEVNVCSRCGRLGEDEWSFCPACGFSMQTEERG